MIRERYITDNPFRLLNLSSTEGYASLRRKADAAARSMQVGLAPEVPLAETFGADLEGIQSQVRTLATDPEMLTVYRMLWPMDEEGREQLLAESGASASIVEDGEQSSAADQKGHSLTTQTTFLNSWYAFLLGNQPKRFEQAVKGLIAVGGDKAYRENLKQCLIEDGTDERDAKNIVARAGAVLVRHVCTRGVTAASEAWQENQRAEASRILDAARSAPLSESDEEVVLGPILSLGDRLASELDRMDVPPATQISGLEPLCVEIEELAKAVGRHPVTARWLESALDRRTQLAAVLRDKAIEVANEKSDYSAALEITWRALALGPSDSMRDALRRDLEILQGNVAAAANEALWDGIVPVRSAPTMRTLNGIGTKMYGASRFEADRRYELSNLYFTIWFLPIFPLARYLVQREGDAYRFFGQAPWTKWMKVHLGASFATAVVAFLWIGSASSGSTISSYPNSESESDRSDYSSDTYTASAPAPAPAPVQAPESTPGPDDEPSVAPSQDSGSSNETFDEWVKKHGDFYKPGFEGGKTKANLEKELDELNEELDKLEAKIDASEKNIDSVQANLVALKAKITRAVVDRTNSHEVDLYNHDVDRYEKKRAAFNAMVNAHNKLVVMDKRKVKRHDEIVQALDGEGGQ